MTTESQQAENQEPVPTRLPFDAEFFTAAHGFSGAVLANVPELHGLAIIPLWNVQPENIPAGLLKLRNPQPPYLASLLMLLKTLTTFGVEAHRDMIAQLTMFDRYAAELAAQIKAKKEELEQSGISDTQQNG